MEGTTSNSSSVQKPHPSFSCSLHCHLRRRLHLYFTFSIASWHTPFPQKKGWKKDQGCQRALSRIGGITSLPPPSLLLQREKQISSIGEGERGKGENGMGQKPLSPLFIQAVFRKTNTGHQFHRNRGGENKTEHPILFSSCLANMCSSCALYETGLRISATILGCLKPIFNDSSGFFPPSAWKGGGRKKEKLVTNFQKCTAARRFRPARLLLLCLSSPSPFSKVPQLSCPKKSTHEGRGKGEEK